MLGKIISYIPWWTPLLAMTALIALIIWYDLRALAKPKNDGGTF